MLTRRQLILTAPLVGCARKVPSATAGPATARAGRFAELRGFCDGAVAVPAGELATRQEAVRARMASAGVRGLVLEAGTDLRYFTGGAWWPSERPLLFILPVDGEPLWVGPAFEEGTLRESLVKDAPLRTWHEHESAYALAAAALRDVGVTSGKVALGASTRYFVATGLSAASPGLAFVDGSAVVDAVRMVKSPAELALLERANEATKAAIRAAAAHVEKGMTEDDLATLLEEAQTAAGLGGVWTLVAFGPNAAFPHGTQERRELAETDLILVDTGGALHGYQSDVSRTWSLGEPPARAQKLWGVVRRAQDAAMERIRPGARCADADAAARAVMAAEGLGADYEAFTHRLGHGIGMNGHEPPYLVRANETILAPGMTMSNEPGVYVRGELGIRIEDIVAVTETGVEVFGERQESWQAP